jgi:hypothetical protein
VLGAVLLRGEQPLGVALATGGGAGDRVQARPRAFCLHVRLRGRAHERDAVELEQEEVRRRVDLAQRAVNGERRDVRVALGALRENDLEDVAAADVLLRDAHPALVLGPVRVTHGGTRARTPPLGLDRPREHAGHLVGVADEHVGGSRDVVEAQEDVGHDEAALGDVRAG